MRKKSGRMGMGENGCARMPAEHENDAWSYDLLMDQTEWPYAEDTAYSGRVHVRMSDPRNHPLDGSKGPDRTSPSMQPLQTAQCFGLPDSGTVWRVLSNAGREHRADQQIGKGRAEICTRNPIQQ